jgi:3-oxoacyl-[acyl-carrier protein] reductase
MSGRVALVTGASRGLGAAMAVALAESGHRVAVNYFERAARAEELCAGLRARGFEAQTFQADVRDEGEVARLVGEVEAKLGAVEVLVVNATGHQPLLSIEEQTWQAYLDQLEFFVKSPLLRLQAVLPGMRARGFGRVIQIGSEVVELGNPRFANYVAAKAAQLGQTRSWARELGGSGITVNLVAPGCARGCARTDGSAGRGREGGGVSGWRGGVVCDGAEDCGEWREHAGVRARNVVSS